MIKKVRILFIMVVTVSSLAYAGPIASSGSGSAPGSGSSGVAGFAISKSSKVCYNRSRGGWYPGKLIGKAIRNSIQRIRARRARRQARRAQRRGFSTAGQCRGCPGCGSAKGTPRGSQFESSAIRSPQAPTTSSVLKESLSLSIKPPITIGNEVVIVLSPDLAKLAEEKIEIKTVEIDGESKSVYKIGTTDQDNNA